MKYIKKYQEYQKMTEEELERYIEYILSNKDIMECLENEKVKGA